MPFDKRQDSLEELGYLIAEGSKNVVFVVGAGLSILAGLPTWKELIDFLLDETIKEIGSREADAQKRDALINRLRSFSDLWLAGDEIAKCLPRDLYVGLIKDRLKSTAILET